MLARSRVLKVESIGQLVLDVEQRRLETIE
jgi:hypothetical protein